MTDSPPAPELDEETLAFAARVFDLARHGDSGAFAALLDQGCRSTSATTRATHC